MQSTNQCVTIECDGGYVMEFERERVSDRL